MLNTEEIRNVPTYAYGHPYWVVREADGEYWFYGAYDTLARAREVAAMVDGLPVENPAA